MAVVGHPIHAMLVHFPVALVMATLACDLMYWWGADVFWLRAGLWAAGGAFATGVAASVVGVMEILAVRGIRARVASWSHAVAGLTLLAIMGANWGVRFGLPEGQLAHQLVLSVMAAISAGYAGWHGGKLVFDEGVGLKINPGD
ncbi:MAG: DUF2231 domain-containing protein [Pseudomonadota bacterium]|nr:DUF2231 domain-containing protein [Pseudomonadota bacterium]